MLNRMMIENLISGAVIMTVAIYFVFMLTDSELPKESDKIEYKIACDAVDGLLIKTGREYVEPVLSNSYYVSTYRCVERSEPFKSSVHVN